MEENSPTANPDAPGEDQTSPQQAAPTVAAENTASQPTELSIEEQEKLDQETDEEYNRLFKRAEHKPAKDFFEGAPSRFGDKKPLAEELGIEDIYNPLVGAHGRVFCAAGPDTPLVVIDEEALVIHPPQLPLMQDGQAETYGVQVSPRGILLDFNGTEKKIPMAKYRGRPIYYFGECVPGSYRHYAVVEDAKGDIHYIYDRDSREKLSVDEVFRLRNRTHDSEIGRYPHLISSIDEFTSEPERVNPEGTTDISLD
ncbi:MAG: hypothetical protein BWY75_02889 [bacterium ADurb.Bin425]|nr:MAG: hypothetical protein BWY75_02889 [bacterium ADurb.Bin425]